MRNQFTQLPELLYDMPSLQGVSVDTSIAMADRGVKKLPAHIIGVKRGFQDDSLLQGGDAADDKLSQSTQYITGKENVGMFEAGEGGFPFELLLFLLLLL